MHSTPKVQIDRVLLCERIGECALHPPGIILFLTYQLHGRIALRAIESVGVMSGHEQVVRRSMPRDMCSKFNPAETWRIGIKCIKIRGMDSVEE